MVYKAVIQYMGTGFSGFQIQKDLSLSTVQGLLQNTLSRIFSRNIKVYGAGRTDSGVHALGQVIHFETPGEMAPFQLMRAMNGLMKSSVTIESLDVAEDGFHARFSARARSYLYILDNSPAPSAFFKDRAWWYPLKLDMERMKEASRLFEGEHDFVFFAKGAAQINNTKRTMTAVEIISAGELNNKDNGRDYLKRFCFRDDMILFYFNAPSFLHSQIRITVGCLVDAGLGNISLEDVKKMLEPDLTMKPKTWNVPPEGLYLLQVDYPAEGKERIKQKEKSMEWNNTTADIKK